MKNMNPAVTSVRAMLSGMSNLLLCLIITACAGQSPGPPAADTGANPAAARSSRSSSVVQHDDPPIPALLAVPRLDFKGAPEMGNREAKIGIVEFTDYQCSYCRQFHGTVFPKIKKNYVDAGAVRYMVMDFPLRRHKKAVPAAMAARCARKQGKFWEMRAALFANQARLGRALYPELARGLALDEGPFSLCLGDPAMQAGIRRDRVLGQRVGVSGTPTFVLGRIEGETLVITGMARGVPDFDGFAAEIGKLMK